MAVKNLARDNDKTFLLNFVIIFYSGNFGSTLVRFKNMFLIN